MNQQLAALALSLVNNSPIRGADAENTATVKRWLAQIAEGKLVVGQPVPEKPPKGPKE